MQPIRRHRRRPHARLAEMLERRQCFSYVMPAFADQLGLTGAIDPNTTFEDNFDGASLDRSKWQVREGPRWRLVKNGNIADMTYTSEAAVRVGSGNLEIVAHNNPATGHLETGWIQSSDSFLSKRPEGIALPRLADGYSGGFEQVYGYWEARMKFSSLPGQWSAFWVHSYRMTEIAKDATRTNHPEIYGAEYDVVEHAAVRNGGNDQWNVSQTGNWNGYDQYYQANAVHPTPSTMAPLFSGPEQFHTYGLLWTDSSVKFTLDGNVTMTLTDPKTISKVAQTIILSNEAGAPGALEEDKGSNYWGSVPAGGYGDINASQARMTVDYVRVWKFAGQPDPTLNTTGASIDGAVYQDLDGDGLMKDGVEPGIPNRTVWIDLDYDGTLDDGEPTRVTDANGTYKFTGLPKGIYTVRQVMDGAYSTQTSPETTADGTISMSGAVSASVDFGLTNGSTTTPPPVVTPPPTTTPTTASITGSVFNDANNNGKLDAGEPGQANLVVYLDQNMNGTRDAAEPSVTTAANGTYRFDGVAIVNALAVRLALSGSGYTQTYPIVGSDAFWLATSAGVTHALGAFGVRSTASTGTGGTTTTPPTGGGSLAGVYGSVFDDADKNGSRGSSEAGKGGVLVYLDYNYNGARDSDEPITTSAADGSWAFDAVRVTSALAIRVALSGTGLTQTLPGSSNAIWLATSAGRVQNVGAFGVNGPNATGGGTTTPTTGTGSGSGSTTTPPTTGTASVTGTVFNDGNKNGTRDGGETGTAGVRVYLDANMNGVRDANETITTLTAADGSYRLDGVKPASAAAVRIDLTGTSLTQTTSAGAGARWIAPVAGQVHAGNDFGVSGASTSTGGGTTTPPPTTNPPTTGGTASLAGILFNDANKNGNREATETYVAAGNVVYVDENMNGQRDSTEAYGLVGALGAWQINGVKPSSTIAIRTVLTDAAHRMTTISGAGARWVSAPTAQLFANIVIGIALK